MSKNKEIDRVAEYLHEVMLENLKDSVGWAIEGTDLDNCEGDEYTKVTEAVMTRTIEYMLNWLETNAIQFPAE